MRLKLLTLITIVSAVSGCTRSFKATYKEGLSINNNSISGTKIAVNKFEDERAWIDSSDEKSYGYIAQQGPWKFGLTYDGQKYIPVATMLQNIFVKEFKALGADAFANQDPGVRSQYNLSGKILNFEFENEVGMWTVTSRRHVSLALSLTNESGEKILTNELFSELDRENEGMAVMHGTNVNKLMIALKKVITSVVEKINAEYSFNGTTHIHVTFNDSDITRQLRQESGYASRAY